LIGKLIDNRTGFLAFFGQVNIENWTGLLAIFEINHFTKTGIAAFCSFLDR
jgi:hypothetical protein